MTGPRWTRLERGICAWCGRDVALRIPRGGDGSMSVTYRHLNATGLRCEGSGSEPRPAAPAVDYSWADAPEVREDLEDRLNLEPGALDPNHTPLDELGHHMAETEAAIHNAGQALPAALDAMPLQDTSVLDLIAWAQAQRRALLELEKTATLYAGQNLQVPRQGDLRDGRRYVLRKAADRKRWDHERWQHDVRQAVIREAVPESMEVIDTTTGEVVESARRLAQRTAAGVEAIHGAAAPRTTSLRGLGLDPDDYCETTPGPWAVEFIDTPTTED